MYSLKNDLPDKTKHYIGTAVMPGLLDENEYRYTVEREFNSVVVEHHMKWQPLCPKGENIYDFSDADKIVDWARSRGMNVKGHTLVWHVTSPQWLQEKSATELKESMRRHIYTCVAHFRDRVDSWDVVNEALAPDGSFAQNIFYEKLGKQYIEDSFTWARKADPNCSLIYNDNKVEAFMNDEQISNQRYCKDFCRKSNAMFELVEELIRKKVPIDEVGLQAHFNCAGTGLSKPPPPLAIKQSIQRYEALGLKINLSELDVRVSGLPDEVDKDEAQSSLLHDTVKTCYESKDFRGITFWGFTDKYSWVHEFYGNDTPLLWDRSYKYKPAYFGVRKGLQDVKKNVQHDWSKWLQPEPSNTSKDTLSGSTKPDWEVK